MDKPRVRFAPSPTGYLHIGGARTALFNWLWARHHGGTFILRIEDTDQGRSTKEAEAAIFEGLRWLGLDWDEGPDIGGPHGPYFQMERLDLGRKKAEAEKRQYRYPGTCREKAYDKTKPHVIRFRVPEHGATAFDDLVKGHISTPHDTLQDEVILRSDRVPLYNFGAVVDDITMQVNLVGRGDDHVNNTARQILMYRALGYPVPRFAHFPMILGADKARLSKRHGATSVTAYRDMGFLPAAVVNYLVRLGWSHGDQEIFTLEELVRVFDLEHVGQNAAVFDPEKMAWVNHEWLKKVPEDDLARKALPFFRAAGLPAEDDTKLRHVVRVARERAKTLGDYAQQFRYFYAPPAYDPKAREKFLTKDTRPILEAVRAGIAALPSLDTEPLEKLFQAEAERRGLGLGKIAQPVRVALTGGTASPGMYDVVQILGKEETLRRRDEGIR